MLFPFSCFAVARAGAYRHHTSSPAERNVPPHGARRTQRREATRAFMGPAGYPRPVPYALAGAAPAADRNQVRVGEEVFGGRPRRSSPVSALCSVRLSAESAACGDAAPAVSLAHHVTGLM